MKLNDIINSGSISEQNAKTLQYYVCDLADKTEEMITVLDLGTGRGTSAIAMALAAPNVKVLTVDPAKHDTTLSAFKEFGLDDRIVYYEMTGDDFSPLCPVLDACFIDAYHSYVPVLEDIKNFATKVKKGGYVMFHDRNLYDNTVGMAIDEFEGKLYTLVEEVGGSLVEPIEGSVYVGRRI